MKKLLVLLLTITSVLTLSSCKKEDEITHDIPKENPVNLQELPYAEYLSVRNPVVTIKVKGMGDIVLQLFPEAAPNTVNNFIQYVQANSYDGNNFHRVVDGFVIQAGDIDEACNIKGEFSLNGVENKLLHDTGVISMARVGNDYDSANSQFFIVEDSQYSSSLNGLYASFGGVTSGFNIVDYIASLQDENAQVPTETVTITSITVELNDYVVEDRVCYTEE